MSARVLVSLEDVTLSFGGKPLFEGLFLHVCQGDKICLVGKNGAGKTTLMRMIQGELELDGGKRFAYPGVTMGYLAQNVKFDDSQLVRDFVLTGLPPERRDEAHMHLADMMMEPLELDPDKEMGTLSGGQVRRAALARALLEEPDILLLDEPTNHLDLGAIEWLENYLAAYKGALICVSHDRTFLAAVSRKVFWIDRGKVRTCPKGYSEFDAWMEQIVEQEANTLRNMQKKLEAEEEWTQGGISARRKRNQRRLNELHKLRAKLKSDKAAYKQRLAAIKIESLTPAQASKIIVEFRDVSKSFTGANNQPVRILKDFHFRIMRGDKIGIIGRNGSGKSTFIKLMTGGLKPDKGSVKVGKSVDITYFDQHRTTLNPNKTLWDTLAPDGATHVVLGQGEKQKAIHVCGYLKNFLFDPKHARDRVSTLSGGQQNRLLLAKALATPGNVLILDEPTNDLDMDTLDMLQEILSEYQGTLIIVSHDRDFLDRTVTEIIAFEGDAHVEAHLGGYSDYIEATRGKPVSNVKDGTKKDKKSQPKLQAEKPVSETVAAKVALSYKDRVELEKLPKRIESMEKEVRELSEILADGSLYTSNPEQFDKTSRRLGMVQDELAAAEQRWFELEGLKLTTSS